MAHASGSRPYATTGCYIVKAQAYFMHMTFDHSAHCHVLLTEVMSCCIFRECMPSYTQTVGETTMSNANFRINCIPLDYHSQMCVAWIFLVEQLGPHPPCPPESHPPLVINVPRPSPLLTTLPLLSTQTRVKGHHIYYSGLYVQNCPVLCLPCPVGQDWLLLPGGALPLSGGH